MFKELEHTGYNWTAISMGSSCVSPRSVSSREAVRLHRHTIVGMGITAARSPPLSLYLMSFLLASTFLAILEMTYIIRKTWAYK